MSETKKVETTTTMPGRTGVLVGKFRIGDTVTLESDGEATGVVKEVNKANLKILFEGKKHTTSHSRDHILLLKRAVTPKKPKKAAKAKKAKAAKKEKSTNGDRKAVHRQLFLRARGIEAEGAEKADGFLVLKGSQASKTQTPSISKPLAALRSALTKDGVFVKKGTTFTLTKDHTFSSASTASSALLGRSSNGRTDWRDADGHTLKELQEA